MIVLELIEELKKCDPKSTVYVDVEAARYHVHLENITSVDVVSKEILGKEHDTVSLSLSNDNKEYMKG